MGSQTIIKLALVAFLAVALTACGKKKNGSSDTVATPPVGTGTTSPTSTCTYNSAAHQWLNPQGQICVPTGNSINCNWNGTAWVNPQGQACTPTNGSGPCDYWTNYYHVYYVPINVPPSSTYPQGLACLNINYLNGYMYNTHYYDNYDYWNYDPPHTYGGNHGGSCSGLSIGVQFIADMFGAGVKVCIK
jgi:hypothetical protein